MNIKKINRLNTNEIRYIIQTKRKNFLVGKNFNINIINQFSWKNYNKFWISISNKFHKKAVYRNIVRRIFFNILYEKKYLYKKINWNYSKIYFSFKKDIKYNFEDKNIKEQIKKNIENDLKIIFHD